MKKVDPWAGYPQKSVRRKAEHLLKLRVQLGRQVLFMVLACEYTLEKCDEIEAEINHLRQNKFLYTEAADLSDAKRRNRVIVYQQITLNLLKLSLLQLADMLELALNTYFRSIARLDKMDTELGESAGNRSRNYFFP